MTTTVERTPLEEALDLHLRDHSLIHTAIAAIKIGQMAASNPEDQDVLDMVLTLPHGEKATVAKVIKDLHLNSFIDWGGNDV